MESFLTENASMTLVKGVLDLAKELVEEESKRRENDRLNQKQVLQEYKGIITFQDLKRMERNGLPFIKTGNRRLYKRANIEHWLDLSETTQ
ncbi:hypothetical protein AB1I63_06010 [Streptococcus pneumoniae]